MPPAPPLQQASLFAARGFRHDAFSPCPLLSVKCMFNGSALYRADRAWFAVNEMGYLILNDQQPYEIHIDSPTRVEARLNALTIITALPFVFPQLQILQLTRDLGESDVDLVQRYAPIQH